MTFNVQINDEVDALREAVRKFADGEIAPLAESVDKDNEFPNQLWRAFGDMGLLGMTIPEEYGGTGLNYLSHLVVMEEISRASASIGLSYGANSNLCLNNLYPNGSDEQRHKYLPKLCTGEYIGALAMSEPGEGSDVVGSMSCNAEKKGDKWVASGNTMWINTGPDADAFVVF